MQKSCKPKNERDTHLNFSGFLVFDFFAYPICKNICVGRSIKLHELYHVQSILGENSRLYHSFKSEDFVGRLSGLAWQCSKNRVEHVVLQRFYMGFFGGASSFTSFDFELFTYKGCFFKKNHNYVVPSSWQCVTAEAEPAHCTSIMMVTLHVWLFNS